MKDFGKTRSAEKPEAIVIDEFSVWVHSNIKAVSEPGIDEQGGFKGFEFDMVQYTKDEFILNQTKENEKLQQQITDTQLALCEVYEQLPVTKA